MGQQTTLISDNDDLSLITNHINNYLQNRRLIKYGNEIGAQALQALKSYDKERIFAVAIQMLDYNDPDFRSNGAEMILRLDHQRGVPLVLPLLKDPDDGVRADVCGTLHDLGDERAVDAVAQMLLEDLEPTIRHIAAYTLEAIGNERALPALEWASQHDSGRDWEGRPIAWQANGAIKAIRERIR